MSELFNRSFDELDKKLNGYFAEAKDTDALFEAMTEDFFKGEGGMDTWEHVENSAHESGVIRGITQDQIKKDWDDCVESFFSLPQISITQGTEKDSHLQLEDEIRYNLFLRKPATQLQKKEASKIIAIVTKIDSSIIEKNIESPILKVLINETLEKVQTVQQMFNQASLVSTIKPCIK